MSKVQTVRALVEQRLTAAAEEIFGLFERTIAEYEEELHRQQKLLDAVLKPQIQLQRSDVQQLSVSKEVTHHRQQEISNQEEPPHIKEEQEEHWTGRQGEQQLEEADPELPFTSVLVKSEYEEEEEAQPSLLHERQTEEKRKGDYLETEAAGEDCGGSEPNTNSNPDSPLQPATDDETPEYSEPDTDDSGDWEDTKEPQLSLNSSQNNEVPDAECNNGKTSVSNSECGENRKGHLQKNSVIQTEENPFSCSVCGETFSIISSLTLHLKEHSDGKRFTCSVCKLSFDTSSNLVRHVRIHTGEKPFSCSVCGQRFTLKQHLKYHFVVHGGEKPFNCSICGKSFYRKDSLVTHMRLHSVGKYFSCSVCKTSFGSSNSLLRHMRIHTGEKPFSCSVCGKGFAQNGDLRRHVAVHTGEKPYSCSVCGKSFVLHSNLRQHLTVHTGEKPFTCSICNKKFTRLHNVKKHKCVGESSTSK